MTSITLPLRAPARPTQVFALLLAALPLGLAWQLYGEDSASQALGLSLAGGTLFGVMLQRSRFCFFCLTRDFVERRDPRGALGILAALAVGLVGYHLLFGAFTPDPFAGRLPPDAHIGPVSWVLAVAAALFGLGMAISGSCISAHLYRLGEGAFASLFALLGALLGFGLGFLAWNTLYLGALQEAPLVWLPAHLGYGGSLLLQLAVLGALAAWLLRYRTAAEPAAAGAGLLHALFSGRWPTWAGGLLIGFVAVLAYFRVGPLGVTAELGSLARTGADALGLLPERLEGLDSFAGCATAVKDGLLSENGLFVLGIFLGAWASALLAGDFRPSRPNLRDSLRNFAGGILLGLGAMLALGCTVGTLLSGIMAGALSGWVFALFCLAGLLLGLKLRARLG